MENESIRHILDNYNLSHRFIVKFAVACAKSTFKFTEPKKESLIAIGLAERFSLGESISKKELDTASAAAAAANASYAAASAAAAAAAYAANAANASSNAASAAAYAAANAAANASYAAAYAAYDTHEKELHALLISMIKQEHTKFECLMMGITA